MLTNFGTVNKRLQRLKELEEVDFDDVASSAFTKKELLMQRRERDKLARTLGGVRDMAKVPSAVWVVDTKKEHLAVAEARKLNIPVVAILDTNCDPDEVDFPIPGNDDAIRAVSLLTRVIADAAADGLVARAGGGSSAGDAAAEPLAEWERELLQAHEAEQAAAAEAPAEAAAEAPAADAPAAEAAADEAPAAEAPVEEAAADEAPAAEAPVEEAAADEAPAAEAPAEEAAADEAAAEEAPAAAEAPAEEAPAAEAPAAEAP